MIGLPKTDLKNLDKYKSARFENIQTQTVKSVVKVFAFALVGIIAAGCAALLIATSGGPTNALLFYGGLGFGVVSAGFFLLALYQIVATCCIQGKYRKLVTPQDIFKAMCDNTKTEQWELLEQGEFKRILEQMNPKCFGAFVQEASNSKKPVDGRILYAISTQYKMFDNLTTYLTTNFLKDVAARLKCPLDWAS